jgi:Fic family protein
VQDNGLAYPKGWKKINNIVWNDTTTDRTLVPDRMEALIQWYKTNKWTLFPLQLAIEFYYRFEKIHPFLDGNGRVGRLLMNKILLSYQFIPLTIFADNQTAHRLAFEKSSSDYVVPIYEFMLEQYIKTLKL